MTSRTIRVVRASGTQDVPFSDNKTILTALESASIEAHYHCRDGFCGACRCKLIRGEVDYTTDPLAFIDDDEILTCCSVPLTDIEIKLD